MKSLRQIAILLLSAVSLTAAVSDARLADAAEERDHGALSALVAQGAAVNAEQIDGMTALHWAANHDDLKMVSILLNAGANVSATNRYGLTSLSLACTNGNGAMVEAMLDAGADPNTMLIGGETVLMTASRSGSIDAVRALLADGAEVDRTVRGQTALMWAAAEGHSEVANVLLEAGADRDARVPSGFTPLLFAVRQGHINVVRTLLDVGADVNAVIANPVIEGKTQRYFRSGLRPGSTPLLVAAVNGHFELGGVLLEAGADPNAGETGYSVLHVMAKVRKPGVGDNNPPPTGSGNVTSLDFVEQLVAHGADLDARITQKVRLLSTRLNMIGVTPFLAASQTADADLMRKLVELGADPSITNEDNSTALMIAAGIATRSPGEDAGTESEVVEALQFALDLGADIDAVDAHGETAMHGAAYKNLPGAVRLLADHGADINIWHRKNEWGWTPLTISEGYRFGNFKPSPTTQEAIQEVMLAAGVDPISEPAESFEIY
jgi:ankyrin repeat protein